jgi:hypothetical protein
VHIFATMNPESTGGGRSRLPPSILALFSLVHLDPPTEPELRQILGEAFRGCVHGRHLTDADVAVIFDAHRAANAELGSMQHRAGMAAGVGEYNLRDLMKVRDMVQHLMADLVNHGTFLAGGGAPRSSSSSAAGVVTDVDGVKVQALQKVLEVVYAMGRREPGEQQRLKAVIRQHVQGAQGTQVVPVPSEAPAAIDTGSAGILRIGGVYMPKGSHTLS